MTKITLSKAIPFMWMRSQVLLEPRVGPSGLAQGKAEKEKGSERGQETSGSEGVSSGEAAKKKTPRITEGSKTNSSLVQEEGSKLGKAQEERQRDGR